MADDLALWYPALGEFFKTMDLAWFKSLSVAFDVADMRPPSFLI
jgi:hypothetical protein